MKNEKSKISRFKAFLEGRWHRSPLKVRRLVYGAKNALYGAILAVLLLGGCGTAKNVPISTDVKVEIKDSTVIHIKDSLRITEATRYRDMAWLGDSLKIEGNRSRCWAVADTARGAIVGGLEEDEVSERTRVVYRDRWKVRDSLVFRDVPIEIEKPVEVIKIPLVMKILSVVGLLSLAGLIIWLVGKIKGFDILKKIRLK